MNESFFKECMRQYHIFHIRQIKKTHFKNQLSEASSKNKEIELENLEKELKSALQLNTQLQSNIKKLESRLKIIDLSHTQRFSNITNQLREKAKVYLLLQTDLENRNEEANKVETLLATYQARIVDFETKMGYFEAEVSRNQLLTSENAELKKQLVFSTSKPNPEDQLKDTEQKIAQLLLLNTSLEARLKDSEDLNEKLVEKMPSASDKSNLESRLDTVVRFSISNLIFQIQTKAYEKLNHLFKVKIDEDEINRNIMKKRILHLEKCLTASSLRIE
jgi:chromosome segregation ATPase